MAGAPRRWAADQPGVMAAVAGSVLGVGYAAVSAYWGFGGTALLDTVGGMVQRAGRAGDAPALAAVWLTVALKLIAAAVGLLATGWAARLRPAHRRLTRRTAWAAAVILTLYGGVLTVTGLLIQTNVIHAAPNADHHALRWHAFLWDPWFLLWGLLLTLALARSRRA